MNLREALIQQAPSLALQRAAADEIARLDALLRPRPIATAPRDGTFILLICPSGYTTTPFVYVSGRMCPDYHAGRWIDHANDDLTDWGLEPTHWLPLPPGASHA